MKFSSGTVLRITHVGKPTAVVDIATHRSRMTAVSVCVPPVAGLAGTVVVAATEARPLRLNGPR
jgi:hypothetical protein